MNWFGEPWPNALLRAPICQDDALRVPTPLGERCLWCRDPIDAADRGILIPCVDSDGVRIEPEHIECQVRSTMGGPAHLLGACSCTGAGCDPDLGMPAREAAKLVWLWVERQGGIA